MSERLDPLLGFFQAILADTMFLSIARLTDKDTRHQANLSVWTLRDAVLSAESSDFAAKVDSCLNEIWNAAADIRTHRHKRVAHFDRNVGLKVAFLPVVQFGAFKTVLEMIERHLNLFFWEFEKTTMVFKMLSTDNITGKAEMTAIKAHVYDLLEQNGTIPRSEWRRYWQKRKRSDTNEEHAS
jgi:AbiU2